MTPMPRGFVWSAAVLTWLAWAGCGSDQPLCAQIGQQAQLPSDSLLALTRDPVLLRAGDNGFVLAGLDGNTTVRWGQLKNNGDLSHQSSFDLPEPPATTAAGQSLGPLFAVTSKTVPGDQLVVVRGVQASSTDPYEVNAWVYDWESQDPVNTTPALVVQGPAPDSGPIRLVAGSSPDGTRALVAWGVEGQPIQYQMLGADGAQVLVGADQAGVLVGKPGEIYDPNSVPRWSCLDTTQNNAANLAVTLVEAATQEPPQQPVWHRFEINDDGSTGGQVRIPMKFDVTDCRRIVSTPTSDGNLLAWQNNASNGGTYFAISTPPPPDASPNSPGNVTTLLVLASASYGGYSQMPKLAWIAPAGYEFTIGLAGSRGPEVVRFNIFADIRGKTLYLPSVSGNTGPVSAWVGTDDAVYVTYLDMPGSPAQADASVPARYLVTVLSPAALP